MPRFAKRPDCPASAALADYAAGTLSFLARTGVAAHLSVCEFCDAESSLLSRHTPAAAEMTESFTAVPPLPLALRVLAESVLADMRAVRAGEKRAA